MNPVKILLINPPFNISKDNYDSSISVGLLCLASYLDKHGFKSKIIDGARQKNYKELIEKEVPDSNIVGFSVMTTQTANALAGSKRVRELNPNALIVYGGLHPTLFPESTAKHPFVDVVVAGEGEKPLLEIVRIVESRVPSNLKDIRGIAFKDEAGGVVMTGKRPLMEMQDIPLPNWNLEPEEILEKIDIIPTHTSRGCPHRCAFCINAILKNIWRCRQANEVLEDIRIIKGRECFKNKPLRFWDENFFVNKRRAEEIIDGMINNNLIIPWETTVRANYIREGFIDDKFLIKLKKSGCYLLSFGAESGSEKVLKNIDKEITREEIVNSARKCLEYGITPQYSFMVGLPGESYKDVKLTLSLIDKLVNLSEKVQILGPQAFRPYPGGTLYEECLKSGWREPESLDEWAKVVGNELNYLTPRNFPWLENPDFIEALEAYVRFGAHSVRSAFSSTVKASRFLKLAFILLCKLRWKLKFFFFPWDFKLAKRFISRSKVYN